MTNTRRKSLISTWSYKAVNGQKGPLVTMKLGSFGMSTSHWYAVVALWFAPGAEEGHGTAQRARTYSTVCCQSRILPTGYKVIAEAQAVVPQRPSPTATHSRHATARASPRTYFHSFRQTLTARVMLSTRIALGSTSSPPPRPLAFHKLRV